MSQQPRPKVYVTLEQLVQRLLAIDHATPITIVTSTVPKMRKTGNQYYDRIRKITVANVFANCNYEAAVNRQREREHKEQDFVVQPRAFGTRITLNGKNTPVIEYTNKDGQYKRYLEIQPRPNLKFETSYIIDGVRPIEKEEFDEYLQVPAGNGERQGLNQSIVVNTYDVRNLVEVRMFGSDYVVVRG